MRDDDEQCGSVRHHPHDVDLNSLDAKIFAVSPRYLQGRKEIPHVDHNAERVRSKSGDPVNAAAFVGADFDCVNQSRPRATLTACRTSR